MPKAVVRNEEGLFADLSPKSIITSPGLQRLTLLLPRIEAEHPKLAPAARAWIDAAARCPTAEWVCGPFVSNDWTWFDKNEAKTFVFGSKSSEQPEHVSIHGVKAWLSPISFSSARSGKESTEVASATAEGLGWAAAAELAARKGEIAKVARLVGIAPPSLGRADQVLRLSAGWSVEEFSPSAGLSEAECCAIYMVSDGGYLNDKGAVAPLAGARLFESAEAARRTMKSRGIRGAMIVNVQARAVSIVPGSIPSGGIGHFDQALAETEARQLQESLARANLDQLRQRVAELEAASNTASPGSALTPPTAKPKPRRV
jgi:hypothetical protein